MKISYECGACFLRQAREAMDLACDDEILKIEIMNDIFNFLSDNFSKDTNSNKTGSIMHNIIKSKTGCEDPYYNEKVQGNEIALKYLPDVKNILKEDDSLETYVKIAIIGNILDFGAFTLDDDIDAIIGESLNDELAIKDIDEFENSLKKHDEVLYLVDNTGEIVFDKLLMDKIRAKGVNIAYVTLHVGLGTFRPVKVDDVTKHKMHSEHYEVPEETAELIKKTKQSGKRVIAVGTTSCRTLESVAAEHGEVVPCEGFTEIFIYPGFEFKVLDGLITNFHLPESTLIMLVSAFAGYDNIMNAYKTAVKERYRFFSFGDAMCIL